MSPTLISSSPSPYARKIRIALAEKGIPFTLRTEIPWDATTETPSYNPLEKLPVLISEDGKNAVYESSFIFQWLEAKASGPSLMPPKDDIDAVLKAKQIEVVADGVCDAAVLAVWEERRAEDAQSREWLSRQNRKIDGGLKALAGWVDEAKGGYLVNGTYGLADIAVGSLLGFLSFRNPDHEWKTEYPHMKQYWDMLEGKQTFKDTVPFPFEGGIKDKVV